MVYLFAKVWCIILQKRERTFCPVYCVSTRVVRLDARPVRSWIYIDVRILVLHYCNLSFQLTVLNIIKAIDIRLIDILFV
jgi:hypothetical protein